MKVTVVDSIMGSGKSHWARKYMNDHPENRWWYVTTYNAEVDKTVELCEKIHMQQPTPDALKKGSNKMDHLLRLIEEGANIALTHALFLSIELTEDEIRLHVRGGVFDIDSTDRKIIWKDYDYNGNAASLIPRLKTGNVYHPGENENALIWTFNHEVFDAFQSIYILTYYFVGSRMYHYMKWCGDEFVFKQTDGEILMDNDDHIMEKKNRIRSLITIEYSNLNNVGGSTGHSRKRLSSSWYQQSRNDESIQQLFKNAYNFLHNKCRAVWREALYTTYKNIAENNPLISFKHSFLSCTTTSSNEFSDRKYLAYLVNIFENPAIVLFFKNNGIKYNQDEYALNSMMQWIWRSCIRKGEPIRIYIPSVRMREMLEAWFVRPE